MKIEQNRISIEWILQVVGYAVFHGSRAGSWGSRMNMVGYVDNSTLDTGYLISEISKKKNETGK